MKTRIIALLVAVMSILPASAFRADTLRYNSKNVPGTENVTVLIPDVASAGQKVPVVYVLHGYDGDYKTWTTITAPALGELADQYGMLLVMPDGKDSWYWDSPRHPEMKMETFIINELVPDIDRRYPTIADPELRAITGLSMGGQGALYLAARHPDVFKNAGSMSGGVDIRPFPKSWKMANWLGAKDEYPQEWESRAIPSLIEGLRGSNVPFDCGVDDFFFPVNEQLHARMMEAGIPHDFTARPGKHSHAYWRNSVLYHLLFFNENFRKAQERK